MRVARTKLFCQYFLFNFSGPKFEKIGTLWGPKYPKRSHGYLVKSTNFFLADQQSSAGGEGVPRGVVPPQFLFFLERNVPPPLQGKGGICLGVFRGFPYFLHFKFSGCPRSAFICSLQGHCMQISKKGKIILQALNYFLNWFTSSQFESMTPSGSMPAGPSYLLPSSFGRSEFHSSFLKKVKIENLF